MSGIMSGISSHEVSLVDVFDRLGDNEVISVRAGDLKEFVRQIDEDAAEPSLPFACRGIEHEATLLGRHLAPGDNEEVICDITWLREDVVRACEHVYGVELNRADNGVEEMIDGVLAEIGDGLQDRSTEFGYELIYEHLPAWEEVLKLAPRNVALAAEADSLIREYWGSAYEILLDDATAGGEAAFYVAAPKDESEGGRVDQPTAVFIAYAGDFDGTHTPSATRPSTLRAKSMRSPVRARRRSRLKRPRAGCSATPRRSPQQRDPSPGAQA